MSRSNPTSHAPHPCQRWYEWDGENGLVRYYDKDKKANVNVGDKFTFILLDVLCVIKGWHDHSNSGIQSNEIRDTRAERFVVKAFEGGILAEGFYAEIKDRIYAVGGKFTTNLYIAYKDVNGLVLGSLQLKGSALNAWVEFEKKNREEVWKKAVKIMGYTEGKKGKIIFRMPKFFISEISEQTEIEAKAIDQLLQTFLTNYFKRTRVDQVSSTVTPPADDRPLTEPPPGDAPPPESDDVPF
jgi:hypothetical protein